MDRPIPTALAGAEGALADPRSALRRLEAELMALAEVMPGAACNASADGSAEGAADGSAEGAADVGHRGAIAPV